MKGGVRAVDCFVYLSPNARKSMATDLRSTGALRCLGSVSCIASLASTYVWSGLALSQLVVIALVCIATLSAMKSRLATIPWFDF